MHAARPWRAVVDGGGSHTRAALFAPDGREPVGRGLANGSNLSHGVEPAWWHIAQALEQALQAAGRPCDMRDLALGLGLAGADEPAQARRFIDTAPAVAGLHLWTDGEIALQGAFGTSPGLLLLAGTGSACIARSADGRIGQVGGYGFPSGDEGSGAWLGRRALGHAQRAADGIEPAGVLSRAVWSLVVQTARAAADGADATPVPALRAFSATLDQRRCALLAPLVFDSAGDDPWAERLLQDASAALLGLVKAADPTSTRPVALHGSVALRLSPRLLPMLEGRLRPPQRDALDGALQLLDRALGLDGPVTPD
ncbi:MAG: ATPase [Rubrivivax sp.]|jgi:glucosamine kinase|nr:ATPase [Rubrivivax sp.]